MYEVRIKSTNGFKKSFSDRWKLEEYLYLLGMDFFNEALKYSGLWGREEFDPLSTLEKVKKAVAKSLDLLENLQTSVNFLYKVVVFINTKELGIEGNEIFNTRIGKAFSCIEISKIVSGEDVWEE